MPTVRIEAQLSTDELLKAASQLSSPELDQFASQIIALRAQRQAPCMPQDEAEILIEINRGIPWEIQKPYDALVAKRRQESLTPDEYETLLQLTEQIEQLEVRRMEHLAELARLRQMSLTDLMTSLDIQPPANA